MRTVCDEISELGEKSGFKSHSSCGYEGETWILADFIDVVVHVFSAEARTYYDLDNLWGDARPVDWNAAPVPEASDLDRPAAKKKKA
jgi:ribosome-associated protein